ncbi:hypothetical protein MAPG_05775 [Magnaporthiopsis poae ATCC 64411]|uniref:Uncharacterized protein n=1 Tax=Magnaporthiopsis poae (strain ATCC 64411 / 73-15) TaxID=644358 RepID=A0A0C4E0A6_MAGP6|nr:hypothetical protein MAPG_05775 [Magnaporthiopsis poae ATCC 64411]
MVSGVAAFNGGGVGEHIRMLRKRLTKRRCRRPEEPRRNGMVREECITGLPQSSRIDVMREAIVSAHPKAKQWRSCWRRPLRASTLEEAGGIRLLVLATSTADTVLVPP